MERALFTLSCTVLVACSTSTLVLVMDRWLFQPEDTKSVDFEHEQDTVTAVSSEVDDCAIDESSLEEGWFLCPFFMISV